MNPDPWMLALSVARHKREREAERARQYRLHKAAMERRKKRKRGGKK